jgi:hypothetical protein
MIPLTGNVWNRKIQETESRLEVLRTREENYCLIDTEFIFEVVKAL